MPLGKYYCDYCDKEFQDTTAARRRHLQGIQHQRAKALWYNSLLTDPLVHNDPESFGKGVCNRFVRTGSCQYGESCRYYHPKQNTQNMNLERIRGNAFNDDILKHNLHGQAFGATSFPGDIFRDKTGASLGTLPPSLMPPPEGGYPPLPFLEWG
ncbi:zinc finger CCCH domain-containing protein 3 isoform X1 [Ipomoea triloba]|uniref:zinc finger CCCH domain-containing protein 3 isoform X1 n=1 Tax=Ipomoea triloba TaxID=35885 RepID=UPI00125DE14C|nr:zinc finger CCCH domain-containing protein 3 isoform X1 [Ipomoea triloba]